LKRLLILLITSLIILTFGSCSFKGVGYIWGYRVINQTHYKVELHCKNIDPHKRNHLLTSFKENQNPDIQESFEPKIYSIPAQSSILIAGIPAGLTEGEYRNTTIRKTLKDGIDNTSYEIKIGKKTINNSSKFITKWLILNRQAVLYIISKK